MQLTFPQLVGASALLATTFIVAHMATKGPNYDVTQEFGKAKYTFSHKGEDVGSVHGDCAIDPNVMSKPVKVTYKKQTKTLNLSQDQYSTTTPSGFIPFSSLCADDNEPLPAREINGNFFLKKAGFTL